MTREFVRLPEFEKQCIRIGLDDENVRELELTLLANPAIGDMIVGTGGIRKTRIPLPNRGKSGGARVIYIDFTSYSKIYLITLYDKSDTTTLSKEEKNDLRSLVGLLNQSCERRLENEQFI